MPDYAYTREFVNGAWNAPNNPDHLDSTGEPIALAKEIEAALPGELFTIHASGTALTISFVDTVTDKPTLDATVAAHKGTINNLLRNKRQRILEVNERTVELVAGGFTYDSKTFSMSLECQVNLIALGLDAAAFSYPYKITTKHDDEIYSLPSVVEAAAIYEAMRTRKDAIVSGGVTLIESIHAATDQAELDAVVDSRT